MNGDRVAAPASPNAELGRGLETLIAAKDPALEPSRKKALLPTWFFFAADILLLAYAVAICFDSPKPLDLGAILFCAAAISLGAILGIAGILRAMTSD